MDVAVYAVESVIPDVAILLGPTSNRHGWVLVLVAIIGSTLFSSRITVKPVARSVAAPAMTVDAH